PHFPKMLQNTLFRSSRTLIPRFRAPLTRMSTLQHNPHIHVFKDPIAPNRHLLSLLDSSPPTPELSIGTTTSLPVTPDTFTENHNFLEILHSVFRIHAQHDPSIKREAAAFASPGGFNLGGRQEHGSGNGAGAGTQQGGIGGANRGGWIHVSDTRNPPDWGRIAWPEDIFGSLEVDGEGRFVEGGGNYQPSGTYRIVTREGILGIPEFLREKLVQRLKELEREMKK
ncbi:hypothetical protein BCR34DRAFT_492705, partial [Clohesyomyces aquaticus]